MATVIMTKEWLKKAIVMPRQPNKVRTVMLRLSTTPQVRSLLERLVVSGLYGKNTAEAAHLLLTRRLEDLLKEGFFDRLQEDRGESAVQ